MSAQQATSPASTSRSSRSRAERTRLEALDRRREQLAQVPFLLVLFGILALGMVGLLMLNTKIQTQARQLAATKQRADAVSYQKAQLNAQVQQQRSTAELEKRAYILGLRPNPHPAFIVLPNGQILGKPQPVKGNELPNQYYTTADQQNQAQQKSKAEIAAAAKAKAEAEKKAAADKAKADKAKADKAKADKAKADKAKQDAAKKAAADKAKQSSAPPTAKTSTKPSTSPTVTPTKGN